MTVIANATVVSNIATAFQDEVVAGDLEEDEEEVVAVAAAFLPAERFVDSFSVAEAVFGRDPVLLLVTMAIRGVCRGVWYYMEKSCRRIIRR